MVLAVGSDGLFELLWRQPAAIVIALQELFQMDALVFQITVSAGVDLLPLQGAQEAFAEGIVVRVAGAAHAGIDAVPLQQLHILPG